MNIVFMIGNGFDLNCGMKTSYRDVYAGYCKTNSSSDEIKKFKNRIAGDIENWGDFEVAMAEDMKNFDSEKSFIDCLRDFKRYLILHLEAEERTFKKRTKNVSEELIKAEWVKSCKMPFDGIFLHSERVPKICNRFLHESILFNFISYNYTTSLDFFCNHFPVDTNFRIGYVGHPHGTLQDGPVLGMDNKDQLICANFPISNRVVRDFLKLDFNRSFNYERVEEAEEAIRRADVICIFGLSLGVSDSHWSDLLLKEICKGTDVFFFDYNLSRVPRLLGEDLMDARDKLFELWNVSKEEAEKIEPYFHLGWSDIFNFGEAIRSAKAEEVLATV